VDRFPHLPWFGHSPGGALVDLGQRESSRLLPGSILDGPLTQLYPIRDLLNFKGGGVNQFDCVTCPVLSAGTRYWVVAQQDKPHVEDGWDQSFSDSAWEFAYNLEGSATGPWTLMGSGYIRPAFQVDGN
jgi:hypothetical protein